MYKEKTQVFTQCKKLKKKTSTLDGLFASGQTFDLIKMDIQGAEIPALQGGLGLVKHASFIVLELPFMGQYNEGVPDFLAHITFMDGIGFKPYDLVECRRGHHILFQVDMVFINKTHELNAVLQDKINQFGS